MALKIWGDDPEAQPKPRQSFENDVVGRFRAGHQLNNRPMTLEEWRITTGDPDVAETVYKLFGGQEPQEWDAKGEDKIEVFTATKEVAIIIEKPSALRSRMVLWGRNGKPIYATDGEYKYDEQGNLTDEPDPDASLSFPARKQRGQDGVGPVPDISLTFRLADEPDLGLFRFKTASWGWASDLVRNDVEARLYAADGPVRATLKLEPVSFVAKNGARAGQTVSYTKSSVEIEGPA